MTVLLCVACAGQDAPVGRPATGSPRASAVSATGHDPTGSGATAPDSAARVGGSFTIRAAGDVLVHGPVMDRARLDARGSGYDFRPMLAGIAPQVAAADLAICHMETPLSQTNTRLSGYPTFNTPHELAEAFAATGFDSCSTASNHSLDQGLEGVRATLDVLDAAHLSHAGTARSEAERRRVNFHTVRGVSVAHLSYTYGTNGIPVPASAPWAVNLVSVPAILADARAARHAGARFVVVSMHWGTEYRVEPTAEQQSQARQLLASPDIDLILGDHVHVQQPVRRIGDKYVVYGLGNLLSRQSAARGLPPQTQDGSLISVRVRAVPAAGAPDGLVYRTDAITYMPTFCVIGTYRVVPVMAALADPEVPPGLRAELAASLRRTNAVHAEGIATASIDPQLLSRK